MVHIKVHGKISNARSAPILINPKRWVVINLSWMGTRMGKVMVEKRHLLRLIALPETEAEIEKLEKMKKEYGIKSNKEMKMLKKEAGMDAIALKIREAKEYMERVNSRINELERSAHPDPKRLVGSYLSLHIGKSL